MIDCKFVKYKNVFQKTFFIVYRKKQIPVQYLLKTYNKAFSFKMLPAWLNESETEKRTQKENLL